MNKQINAGVVLVSKFVTPGSKVFSSYIDYIDRDVATRNKNAEKYIMDSLNSEIKQFNKYMDYMGNPIKTSELFTSTKDTLDNSEKELLKNAFTDAQNNDSMMWQSVISFDNRWLDKNGVYEKDKNILDEKAIKRATRKSVDKMLQAEGLAESSIWSAGIHYNTDNLHVHIAIVEPVPMREKQITKTATINKDDFSKIGLPVMPSELLSGEIKNAFGKKTSQKVKKYYKELKEVLVRNNIDVKIGNTFGCDENGNLFFSVKSFGLLPDYITVEEKEEYRGKWKQKTLDTGKSIVVNDIMEQRDSFARINIIKNKNIIEKFRSAKLEDNSQLLPLYADIFRSLPDDKRLWKYNMNALKTVRPKVDRFIEAWINQNCAEDFKVFCQTMEEQENLYQEAYGGKSNDYKENQITALYATLGNSVLKSLKGFSFDNLHLTNDISISNIGGKRHFEKSFSNKYSEHLSALSVDIEERVAEMDCISSFAGFTDEYREAKSYMYASSTQKENYELAFDLLSKEANRGNALAIYDIALMYRKGLGRDIDLGKSNNLFLDAGKGFLDFINRPSTTYNIEENKKYEKQKKYFLYRIAKMHDLGYGFEIDKTKALEMFETVENDIPYAKYSVANFYYNGEVCKKDIEKAFEKYMVVAKMTIEEKTKMPYAIYKVAQIYQSKKSVDESNHYFSLALAHFISMEKATPDDQLQYRIGQMYLKGEGTDIDKQKAEEYLSLSSNQGNAYSQYLLAEIYLTSKVYSQEKTEKAIKLLSLSADKGNNSFAQFRLGKIFSDDKNDFYDIKKAEHYLIKSSKQNNNFAQYSLGKLYFNPKLSIYDLEKAMKYFTMSAKQKNPSAQCRLGMIYMDEKSAYYNPKKAIEHLLLSADNNNEQAKYQLAMIYLKGEIVEENYPKAISYLTDIAENNNPYAQYQLGIIHLSDAYGVKDIPLAISYLSQSSKVGNSNADLQLGKIFYFGIEGYVVAEREKGLEYLNKSASKGNVYAQGLLDRINNPHRKGIVHYGEKNFLENMSNHLEVLCRRLGSEYKDIEKMRNEYYFNRLEHNKDYDRNY